MTVFMAVVIVCLLLLGMLDYRVDAYIVQPIFNLISGLGGFIWMNLWLILAVVVVCSPMLLFVSPWVRNKVTGNPAPEAVTQRSNWLKSRPKAASTFIKGRWQNRPRHQMPKTSPAANNQPQDATMAQGGPVLGPLLLVLVWAVLAYVISKAVAWLLVRLPGMSSEINGIAGVILIGYLFWIVVLVLLVLTTIKGKRTYEDYSPVASLCAAIIMIVVPVAALVIAVVHISTVIANVVAGNINPITAQVRTLTLQEPSWLAWAAGATLAAWAVSVLYQKVVPR